MFVSQVVSCDSSPLRTGLRACCLGKFEAESDLGCAVTSHRGACEHPTSGPLPPGTLKCVRLGAFILFCVKLYLCVHVLVSSTARELQALWSVCLAGVFFHGTSPCLPLCLSSEPDLSPWEETLSVQGPESCPLNACDSLVCCPENPHHGAAACYLVGLGGCLYGWNPQANHREPSFPGLSQLLSSLKVQEWRLSMKFLQKGFLWAALAA